MLLIDAAFMIDSVLYLLLTGPSDELGSRLGRTVTPNLFEQPRRIFSLHYTPICSDTRDCNFPRWGRLAVAWNGR